jgi:hypothetical protein
MTEQTTAKMVCVVSDHVTALATVSRASGKDSVLLAS